MGILEDSKELAACIKFVYKGRQLTFYLLTVGEWLP